MCVGVHFFYILSDKIYSLTGWYNRRHFILCYLFNLKINLQMNKSWYFMKFILIFLQIKKNTMCINKFIFIHNKSMILKCHIKYYYVFCKSQLYELSYRKIWIFLISTNQDCALVILGLFLDYNLKFFKFYRIYMID